MRSFPILRLFLRTFFRATMLAGILLPAGSVDADPPPASEFAVYRLANIAPLEAKQILEELTAETGGSLSIIADGESNRILIRGPQDQRERAIALLEQMDEPPQTTVAKPVEVARPSAPTPPSEKSPLPPLRHQHVDPIQAEPHSNETADSPVGSTERTREQPARSSNQQPLSVYAFQNRSADEVMETLQRLFAPRFHQRAADEFLLETASGQRVSARLTYTAEQCLVSGPAPLVRQFLNLLAQIDAPQTEPGRMTRLLPTGQVEPRVLQKVVNIWREAHGSRLALPTLPQTQSNVEQRLRSAAYQSLGTHGKSPIEGTTDARAAGGQSS